MEPEKRRFVRKRTDQLLYAEFGPDNGSILLNLSEDGCSFQSIAPVREDELRFTFSVGDGRKLAGTGRMAWREPSKKTGGLRFIDPSPELREQVREWLEGTLVTGHGRLNPAAVESEAKRRRKKLREEARLEAQRQKGQNEESTAVETPVVTPVASPLFAQTGNDLPLHTESQNSTPAGVWRGVAGLMIMALVLTALVIYRRELGHAMVSFGSSLAGEEQKASPAPNEVPPTTPVSTNADPAALSSEQGSPQNDQADVTPISNAQAGPAAGTPAAPKTEGAQAASPVDAQSLWSQVETGDTKAELTLADHYLQGEGVTPSCAQARVLLEAAAKRGSTEAKQKLGDLAQAGCQ